MIHDVVSEDKDPVPLLPVPVEDVADLLLLAGPRVVLVATGYDPVYPGEIG